MLKYTEYAVTFSEIPDEISLLIDVSGCKNHCIGCHSPELRLDIGEELTVDSLKSLINKNDGISCVAFMGEGNSPYEIAELADMVKKDFNIKTAIYTGMDKLPLDIRNTWEKVFDFIKIGSYKEELGNLSSPTTNQKLFKIERDDDKIIWKDITYRFLKENLCG